MEAIVKMGSLQDFLSELSSMSFARLSSSEVILYHEPVSIKELCIDLQGPNGDDELMWLHYSVTIELSPGTGEPWTEHGKAVYAAWPGLYDLIWSYLVTIRDVFVKTGIYGIPKDILPLNGDLGVKWNAEEQKFLML